MAGFQKISPPANGTQITMKAGKLVVPDDPISPFIEGDGTGPDIWRASVRVMDAAAAKAFGGKKKIVWWEVYAGEKANQVYGPNIWLPDDTVEAAKEYLVTRHGIDPGRITTASKGAADPAYDNATAEGRSKNRRAQIVVTLVSGT